jgi:glycosyltransferase involved in cell wall biosynthesis
LHLAFIDSLPVGGGLSRFSLLLCKSLIEVYPQLSVDYFIHQDNLKHIPEIKTLGKQVNVLLLNSTMPIKLSAKILKWVAIKLGSIENGKDKVLEEIEQRVGSQYDLAFFPAAHMMKRPDLSIPVVGTLHDFNWKYFFGRQTFSLPFVEMMDEEIVKWMNLGLNICSSHDVVDEAKKLYPLTKQFPVVIPIAPLVVHVGTSDAAASAVLKKLDIDFPYIIFPGNFYPHKNHLNLFTAFSMLKQRKGFENYKLILTGMHSEQVHRGIAERRGVQLLTKNSISDNYDVMGMGYQPNEVIDALIAKAKLLVSPSIYEAICTPAMDAWHFGTPTAISDIPPFREHEKAWGIKSAFFDPMSPANIANVMEDCLNNYDKTLADGKISKINMAAYSWKQVAKGYMDVFIKATETV